MSLYFDLPDFDFDFDFLPVLPEPPIIVADFDFDFGDARDALQAAFDAATDALGDRDLRGQIEALISEYADDARGAFDRVLALSEAELESLNEVYIAYFDRAPDAEGLLFWADALAGGITLEQIAGEFLKQPEFAATYPEGLSNADFAGAVYTNVLGRAPDPEGFDFWVGLLDEGSVGRDTFILKLLEGVKALPPLDAPAAFILQKLADQDYLATKTDIGVYFALDKGLTDVSEAAAALEAFDGTPESVAEAIALIEGFFVDADAEDAAEIVGSVVSVVDELLA